MTLDEAVYADCAGDIASAVRLYDEEITHRPTDRAVANLAVLCSSVLDPGFAAAHQLELAFLNDIAWRHRRLLRDHIPGIQNGTEWRFWRLYLCWIDYGDELDPQLCRELLAEDPLTLAPALYLFMASDGAEAVDEVVELYRQAVSPPTKLNQYVRSVLWRPLEALHRV